MRLSHPKHVIIFMITAVAAVAAFAQEKKDKRADRKAVNLKVLPQNISHDSLMTVMHIWENALGVDCAFCHAAKTTFNPATGMTTKGQGLDFASDDNGAKKAARNMYTMTDSINHHYFSWWDPARGGRPAAVTCYTCHHGHAEPADWTGKEEK